MVHYGLVVPPRVNPEAIDSVDPAPTSAEGSLPFSIDVRARFAETDAMGIVHHASYLAWLEQARVEYLRHIGHPYQQVRESGVDFAVIEATLRYYRPVLFDEIVTIHVWFADMSRASFRMDYTLTVAGQRRTSAQTRHAAIDSTTGEPLRLPAWIVAMGTSAP